MADEETHTMDINWVVIQKGKMDTILQCLPVPFMWVEENFNLPEIIRCEKKFFCQAGQLDKSKGKAQDKMPQKII